MANDSVEGPSTRRKFVRRLLSLGVVAGAAELVFGGLKQKTVLIPEVQAANGNSLIIGTANSGSSATVLHSSPTGAAAFYALNDANTNLFSSGVEGDAAAADSQGVYGYNSATSGYSTGVYGEADSPDGTGVVGFSAGINGTGVAGYGMSGEVNAIGVYGQVRAANGEGVFGNNRATSGFTTGVFGKTIAGDGTGVVGIGTGISGAINASGYNTGVFGRADSPDGTGVVGIDHATSGYATGVYGEVIAADGQGVFGNNRATSGYATGVFGKTIAGDGFGVFGLATGSSGAINASGYSTGVYGQSNSPFGNGVAGYASASSGGAWGVYGETSAFGGVGVVGVAGNPSAVALAARGASGQLANLQEWYNRSYAPLSAVNASGSLGVWNPNPQFNVHVVGTADPASVTVDGVGIVGPNFMFRRARGTPSSLSAVQLNDGLLFLVAKGYGATAFSPTGRANISMYAAENWTDGAQGTYMVFKTTQAGTTTQTEKMRITDTGNILPPADNSGNIGIDTQRWALVRAATVTPGDLVFENGVRATEEADGLTFKNPQGTKIACLDSAGNWHIKGKVIEDL